MTLPLPIKDQFRQKLNLLSHEDYINTLSSWSNPSQYLNRLRVYSGDNITWNDLLAKTGKTTEMLLNALEALHSGYFVFLDGKQQMQSRYLKKTLLNWAETCEIEDAENRIFIYPQTTQHIKPDHLKIFHDE
jgi:hypothetical protein